MAVADAINFRRTPCDNGKFDNTTTGPVFSSRMPVGIGSFATIGSGTIFSRNRMRTAAVNMTLAFFGTHDRMLGLGSTLDGAVTYFAAVSLVRTRHQLVALLAAIFLASAVVVMYEAVQLALSGSDPAAQRNWRL